MATKIQKIQKQITAAVAHARALGATLVARGSWGVRYQAGVGWTPLPNDDLQVCICGAIALSENPTNGKGILHAIAKKYDITIGQAASLSDGFERYVVGEGDSPAYPVRYEHDPVWYRIGRKWRWRADRVED